MGSRRLLALAALVLTTEVLTGCAVAHRYPAYKGRVLELGTDQPIEGAGALAVYYSTYPTPGGDVSSYLGHQGRLTDSRGHEIRPKWFFPFRPFSWFADEVRITIFKYGYGNFPGSYDPAKSAFDGSPYTLRVYVETEPGIERNLLPADREVTFWLPKLEGREEIIKHNYSIDAYLTGDVLADALFPPSGTTAHQFGFGPAYRKDESQ